ncbi:WD40/YVTN/BNR-like repeat-containing protein [Larkinella bovis]|uniref:WD40/YVTN/BNR-like repeat-containing protein n=1 Tax=Larkinella bovis TaxID=683041 RepID=A0ABW0IJZ7_9BACT
MDISSKYFAHFRTPGPDVIKQMWRFWLDIRRVGKARELVSFIWWEINHRLLIYQFRRRYIQFTGHAGLSITSEEASPTGDRITSSFLAENGLVFRAVTIDWKFCLQTPDSHWLGSRFSHPNGLYGSTDHSQSARLIYEFQDPICSLFISRQQAIFVCANGVVYKSDDHGVSFRAVLHFSSSISYFLFNNGMTQLPDDTLVIGEYGSIWLGQTWQNLAFLYYSSDGGNSWEVSDFLIRQGVNKHIHLVKYSPFLQSLLLTDGDNKKQLWMNSGLADFKAKPGNSQTGWRLLTQYHHQTGGYTSMAETKESLLFGSDYLGGTNFIVRTTDGQRFQKQVLPDPYRRSPVMNMVTRQSSSGVEVWAASYSCLSADARSLIMCTRDSGKTWTRVLEFDGTKNEVRFVSSSPDGSEDLYLSITEFRGPSATPCHRVYKLERTL